MIVLGVDVGGTFTDLILVDAENGRSLVHKVPSSPESQDIAVAKGIREILKQNDIDVTKVKLVVHGTTVATNAMLERKGAAVCLVTTEGLEDVLEIGRQNRDDIYDLNAKRPLPLVERVDRFGVRERLDSTGNPLVPLLQGEVARIVNKIKERSPEAVAISFLFSYSNPKHERLVAEAVRDLPNLYVAVSSEVLPEFREFERTSTTVLEAYLGPLVMNYLARLDDSIEKLCPNSKLAIMQSNGGTILCANSEGRAVGIAISGLAGGAIGGWRIAKEAGVEKAITLDMGGTSCDISAISGSVILRSDNEVAGLPLRTPSVDVKTIGAGGGSIAWIDQAGILHVGPQSAGADPGPAAYAKGGTRATVTDANLVLGRLNPDYFVGGQIKLDERLARTAVAGVGESLNLTTEQAALGIIRISTANMVQAIREVTLERGADPRNFVLVPFGGAGPTQAVDIADSLGINSILVPPHPGITSAFGLVCADLRVDLMQTLLVDNEQKVGNLLAKAFDKLTMKATSDLIEQGAMADKICVKWSIDMRYAGQSHELNIVIPSSISNLVEESRARFENGHERAFGYSMKDRGVEWVTARVAGTAKQATIITPKIQGGEKGESFGTRDILLETGESYSAPVYRKGVLGLGQTLHGPLIIEQLDTTVYVNPKWSIKQQEDGSLIMRRGVQ